VHVFPDTSSGKTEGVLAQLQTNASEVENIYVGLEVTIIAGKGFVILRSHLAGVLVLCAHACK
jgi:hypothetical protein